MNGSPRTPRDARPPWWALASAAVAPLALVGGFVLAQTLAPDAYDPVSETISALARRGFAHRDVMTSALVVLGLCHLITATGLARARGQAGYQLPAWSPVLLAVAGIGTIGVAAFPLPAHGSSSAHVATALVAFVALVLWPASVASGRGPGRRAWVARRPVGVGVSVLSAALLIWFGTGGALVGLSERLLATQQALWPLVVVIALRRAARPADGPASAGARIGA